MLESLFNKVTGLQAFFIKNRLQHSCFPVSIAKFLRIFNFILLGIIETHFHVKTHLVFTCPKSTIETLEQSENHKINSKGIRSMPLDMKTLNSNHSSAFGIPLEFILNVFECLTLSLVLLKSILGQKLSLFFQKTDLYTLDTKY